MDRSQIEFYEMVVYQRKCNFNLRNRNTKSKSFLHKLFVRFHSPTSYVRVGQFFCTSEMGFTHLTKCNTILVSPYLINL